MITAPIQADDEARLASLRRMHLLSTPAEREFDRVTRIAADLFKVPVALVSLVDRNRQWFKSRHGLETSETPRSVSFCGHAIMQDEILVVEDAKKDSRFHDNPLVLGGRHVVFYAGLPIRNEEGFCVGTLCLIDHKSRRFGAADERRLQDLGRWLELVVANRELSAEHALILQELEEARRESMVCPMTQLWNRRGFETLAPRELARSRRQGQPVCVAMADIDHFKSINDTYGHATGDKVIAQFARTLRDCTRSHDVVARMGGEEFAILMTAISQAEMSIIGDKLLSAVRSEGRIPGQRKRFTSSFGMAWFASDRTETLEQMLETADRALYDAKQGGRNQFRTV